MLKATCNFPPQFTKERNLLQIHSFFGKKKKKQTILMSMGRIGNAIEMREDNIGTNGIDFP